MKILEILDKHCSKPNIHNIHNTYPDLMICLLQTFLWPHLRNAIYRTPVNNFKELSLRITDEINDVNNNAERDVEARY